MRSAVCLRRAILAWSLLVSIVAAAEGESEPKLDDLRLNQLQVIGTHNSYHTRKNPINLGRASEWNYTHAPLDVQLDRGVRSFELDLHYRDGEFLVFHVPLIDEGSTCRTLKEGLATVRRWSEAHPRHVPISFLFELKREGPQLDKRIKSVDSAYLDELDALLKSAFTEDQILTPDDVRGEAATLREAVTGSGWPKLADCRGTVLFILHDEGEQRRLYTENHSSLRGRAMFVRSDESRDDGATLVLDSPRDPNIARLAKAGYYIRTRADSGLNVSPPGQPARRDQALASGAHIVSTDFPAGEPEAKTGYLLEFEKQAPARVNPVSGPAEVAGKAIAE